MYLTIENYSIIAVNVFALISGYLSVSRQIKLTRLVELWVSAITWSALTALVGVAWGTDFGSWTIECAFPVCNVRYWYLDSFLAMQVLLPFVNAGIERFGRVKTGQLAICLIVVFSLLGFAGGLGVSGGYSTIWLLVMWIVGAAIHLNHSQALQLFFAPPAGSWCNANPSRFDLAGVAQCFHWSRCGQVDLL